MTQTIKTSLVGIEAPKPLFINQSNYVGSFTITNTGTEEVSINSFTSDHTAITTITTAGVTLSREVTFEDGTDYFMTISGGFTTEMSETGIKIGTGTTDNRLILSIEKDEMVDILEIQCDLWNTGKEYKSEIMEMSNYSFDQGSFIDTLKILTIHSQYKAGV